jgi:hypothetical protein
MSFFFFRSIPIICALKKKSCKFVATDFSEEMLKRAINRMKKIETDFNGCLNENEEIEPHQKLINEFKETNVSFKLLNNVKFIFITQFFLILLSILNNNFLMVKLSH